MFACIYIDLIVRKNLLHARQEDIITPCEHGNL
jgi:hypothetical protein